MKLVACSIVFPFLPGLYPIFTFNFWIERVYVAFYSTYFNIKPFGDFFVRQAVAKHFKNGEFAVGKPW